MSTSFTLTGHGGVSAPIPKFSDIPFWFVDGTGGVPFSAVSALGVPKPSVPGVTITTGSFLLSTSFVLALNSVLSIEFSFLSGDGPHYDIGVAYLLSNKKVVATLFSAFGGADGVSLLGIVPITPGVTLNPPTAMLRGNKVTLGGITYGPTRIIFGPPVKGGSTPWVKSSYKPGSGTYQLLFMAYNTIDTAGKPTALAIRSVSPSSAAPA